MKPGIPWHGCRDCCTRRARRDAVLGALKSKRLQDALYETRWQMVEPADEQAEVSSRRCAVLDNGTDLGRSLIAELRRRGSRLHHGPGRRQLRAPGSGELHRQPREPLRTSNGCLPIEMTVPACQ